MYDYFFLFAITALTINLTPGPAMIYCVNASINGGRGAGVVAAIGVELGTFVYVLITGLGLSALILAYPIIYSGLRVLGALYLLYLAYKILPSQRILEINQTVKTKAGVLLGGVILNVTNPKILLFFVTLLPQFVPIEHRNIEIFFLLGLAFNFSGFIINLLAAIFSHNIKYSLAHFTKITKIIAYIPSGLYVLIATITFVSVLYR